MRSSPNVITSSIAGTQTSWSHMAGPTENGRAAQFTVAVPGIRSYIITWHTGHNCWEYTWMMTILGWAGSILLALCAIPQAYKSYQERQTSDISASFLWMWFIGEWFAMFYVFFEKYSLPLLLNYASNIVLIAVIMWFYYFPKRD